MVFYYEANQPMIYSLFTLSRTVTIFGMVLRRIEFWLYLVFHIGMIVLFREEIIDVGDFKSLRWEAVNATQLFMVFLLTFFNSHCYSRYLNLYDLCTQVLDNALYFVQELVVSLPSETVEHHRIRAVKYMLAMLHIFFNGAIGGMKTKHHWREVVRRGLLNKVEAEQLSLYPARSIESVLVLATWTMQIVDKALADDVFWEFRSMRVAHTHNRLQKHMNGTLKSIHEIGDVIALPIPFPFVHVVNVVLVCNLFLLTVVMASFSTYQTIFPFSVALLFFLGLREVSSSLSDPFKGQDSDFPIATFLQYAFDTAVCLLEAFRHGSAEDFVSRMLDNTEEFANEQLRHTIPSTILYQKSFDPATSNPFTWNKEMPLTAMAGSLEGPTYLLKSNSMAKIDAAKKKEDAESKPAAGKKGKDAPGAPGDAQPDRMNKALQALCCCCRYLPKSKKKYFVTEDQRLPPAAVLKEQTKTDTAVAEELHFQQDFDSWTKRLKIQEHILEHRRQEARKRGLPVDELIGLVESKKKGGKADFDRKAVQFDDLNQARKMIGEFANLKAPRV